MNCARQRGLSSDILDAKQDAMRSLLGIAELHSMRASPMQAARCSAVYRISADARCRQHGEEHPNRAQHSMTGLHRMISLEVTPPLTMIPDLWAAACGPPCDGHHKNSLLLRLPAADAAGPPTKPGETRGWPPR